MDKQTNKFILKLNQNQDKAENHLNPFNNVKMYYYYIISD